LLTKQRSTGLISLNVNKDRFSNNINSVIMVNQKNHQTSVNILKKQNLINDSKIKFVKLNYD
ncbi:MAG: hypothetical protein JXR90_10060, partial [Spirochaetes bacterium]|nr:hypothetical protein [Spirochaetota bacterium]